MEDLNNSISQFSNDLLKHLNEIKQSFEEQEQSNVNEEPKDTSALSLKKAILEKEKEIALSNFNIGLANQLLNELEELDLCLTTPTDDVVQTNKNEQIAEMQRELTHEAFLKLKELPSVQIQEVLNKTPQLKTLLGDWFSALTLWLGK